MSEKYERVALQHPGEFQAFINLLKKERIQSYLEIGSKFGGSLWRIANEVLPKGSRIVSVDLPHGDKSFKESQPHLEACVRELQRRKYDAHLFLGDSTDSIIVQAVALLSPFDCCLIDANHTEPYVRKDWENYGSLAKIVAFHDIAHKYEETRLKKFPIQVCKVWSEIKQTYRHEEIKLDRGNGKPGWAENGFGVLWRC